MRFTPDVTQVTMARMDLPWPLVSGMSAVLNHKGWYDRHRYRKHGKLPAQYRHS